MERLRGRYGVLAAWLGVLFLGVIASGAMAQDVVIVSETFEDGSADGWTQWDGWTVHQEASGDHVLFGEGMWEWAVFDGGLDWTDCTVRFRVKVLSGGVHLNCRVSEPYGERTRYIFGLREDSTYIGKEQPHDNHFDLVARWDDVDFALGEWHDIEVSVRGGHLEIRINGALQLEFDDADPHVQGTIAFETLEDPPGSGSGASYVYIDDVTVSAPIDDRIVSFPDPALEAAIREELGAFEVPLSATAVSALQSLVAGASAEGPVATLEGIEHCTGLVELFIFGAGDLDDLSPLAGLTSLEILHVYDASVADVCHLSGLANLRALYLPRNDIVDISCLSDLVNLEELNLEGNRIVDIRPIEALTELQWLYLLGNRIRDLAPLARNPGIGQGDSVNVCCNAVSFCDLEEVQTLVDRGVSIICWCGWCED